MNVSFAPLRPDAVQYLSERIGIDYRQVDFTSPHWFSVTVRDDDGRLMGVITAEFKNGFDAHFNVASTDPRCVTRRMLRAAFTALFSRAVRLTALIEPHNERAIRNAVRLGFLHEGLCRRGLDGKRDAWVFGMLREECRYLQEHRAPVRMEVPHGQPTKAA